VSCCLCLTMERWAGCWVAPTCCDFEKLREFTRVQGGVAFKVSIRCSAADVRYPPVIRLVARGNSSFGSEGRTSNEVSWFSQLRTNVNHSVRGTRSTFGRCGKPGALPLVMIGLVT